MLGIYARGYFNDGDDGLKQQDQIAVEQIPIHMLTKELKAFYAAIKNEPIVNLACAPAPFV